MRMTVEQYANIVEAGEIARLSPKERERLKECHRKYVTQYPNEGMTDRARRREIRRFSWKVKLIENTDFAGEPYYLVPDLVPVEEDGYHRTNGKLWLTVDEYEVLARKTFEVRLEVIKVMCALDASPVEGVIV